MNTAESNDQESGCLIQAARLLVGQLSSLNFSDPVTHVYNPLEYAWAPYEQYVRRYASPECRVVFLGMNPGPWGMSQTGIPFGEISAVRDWMKIVAPVRVPHNEHPKRKIQGFACPRSEVSGRRLWGLFADTFGEAPAFFRNHFVLNYCPLVFMEAGGRNRTPDKLPAGETRALVQAADDHLRACIQALDPEWIIGVGAYAEDCARRACSEIPVRFGRILHPSPASPAANRDWAGTARKQLKKLGFWP